MKLFGLVLFLFLAVATASKLDTEKCNIDAFVQDMKETCTSSCDSFTDLECMGSMSTLQNFFRKNPQCRCEGSCAIAAKDSHNNRLLCLKEQHLNSLAEEKNHDLEEIKEEEEEEELVDLGDEDEDQEEEEDEEELAVEDEEFEEEDDDEEEDEELEERDLEDSEEEEEEEKNRDLDEIEAENRKTASSASNLSSFGVMIFSFVLTLKFFFM